MHKMPRNPQPPRRDLGALPQQSLAEAARWPSLLVKHAWELAPDNALLRQPDCVLRTSSTFSGIGTSEWLEHVLMQNGLGVKFRATSVCDNSDDAQAALALAPCGATTCRFHNILDKLPVAPETVAGKDFDTVFKAITDMPPFATKLWCNNHCAFCPVPQVDWDWSGSPCTDHSMQNRQRKGKDGQNNHIAVTYLLDLKRRGVPIWVHENLNRGDIIEMVHRCMGDSYIIQQVFTRAEDVGYGVCRRDRLWLVGVHKQKARFLRPLQGLYNNLCAALCTAQVPQSACWRETDAQELRSELQESAPTHGSSTRGRVNNPGGSWLAALSRGEKKNLHRYLRKWKTKFGRAATQDTNATVVLGQSAKVWWTSSHTDGSLPTFLKSGGHQRFWNPTRRRWMTAREKWGVMGWPVWPDVAVAMNVGMVDVKWYSHPHALIGNSWHFACAGVLKVVVLAGVEMLPNWSQSQGRVCEGETPEGEALVTCQSGSSWVSYGCNPSGPGAQPNAAEMLGGNVVAATDACGDSAETRRVHALAPENVAGDVALPERAECQGQGRVCEGEAPEGEAPVTCQPQPHAEMPGGDVMAAMVGAQGDAPADLRVRFHGGWRAWVVKIKEMQVTAKFPLRVEAEAFLKEIDKLILQTDLSARTLSKQCKCVGLAHRGTKKTLRMRYIAHMTPKLQKMCQENASFLKMDSRIEDISKSARRVKKKKERDGPCEPGNPCCHAYTTVTARVKV